MYLSHMQEIKQQKINHLSKLNDQLLIISEGKTTYIFQKTNQQYIAASKGVWFSFHIHNKRTMGIRPEDQNERLYIYERHTRILTSR